MPLSLSLFLSLIDKTHHIILVQTQHADPQQYYRDAGQILEW